MSENNTIDFSKFKVYYDQLNDIQRVVDKLVTKQNVEVYNKIGTKTEQLFNSIAMIDVKSAPVEDIRTLIDLLKKLRDTCVTLSSYKQYIETVITANINALSNQVTKSQENVSSVQENSAPNLIERAPVIEKPKVLELTTNEGHAA